MLKPTLRKTNRHLCIKNETGVVSMLTEEEHYSGYDGTIMLLRVWKPDGIPRAVVVGIHGLGSHSGLLSFLGEAFASRGFIFYAPDMRGFGTFPGRKGHVDRYSEYTEDLDSLVEQVREGHPDERLFFFGHSLGGMHVANYAIQRPAAPVDGLIIPCPAVSERLQIGGATRMILALLAKFNVKSYFDSGLNLDLISRNPEVVKRNREDPLRFDKVTPRFAAEGLKANKETFNAANRIRFPVLVQQSGDDKILLPERNKVFYDNLASEDKTWKLYPGLYHEPFEEQGGEEVLDDMFSWIDKRI
jgi:alpha-beta hydrolase superfamily lysophospholipase